MRSRSADVPLKASQAGDESRRRRLDDDDDHDEHDDLDDTDEAPEAPRLREGLPPSYRMRHEPHYVETLAAPAPTPQSAPVPAPPPVERPETPADRQGLGAVAASLADALTAIQASLAGVPSRGRPLRERVAIDVALAEACRAQWVADAAVALQYEPLPALDDVDMADVLRRVDDSLALERRLTGDGPTIDVPATACRVVGDARLLTSALGGLLGAVRDLVEDRGEHAKVRLAVTDSPDRANRTLVLTQRAVRVPAGALTRFFDAEWLEHPAGRTGAVLLAAAQRIAAAHGGRLDLGAIDGGGFQLSLHLPAAS